MSTSEKNGGIPEFSADYRGAHPKKKQPAAGRQTGKKELPEPRRTPAPAGGAGNGHTAREEKPAKAQSPRAEKEKRGEPGAARKKTPPPQTVKAPADRMGNDAEIDDFLPPEDLADGERMLTKWDEDVGPAPSAAARRLKKKGKYRYGILVGSLVMVFALIGVGYLAASIGTAIHAKLTDDSSLRAYDKFLTVVVAQDPKPFASPDKADPDFVLNAALWQTMTEEGANYTSYDDAGRTIVPLGDVADACHDLFGPDCDLQPKNPTEETFFEYDSAKAQFHVALYSLDSTYEPYTLSARRENGQTVLRVGYIPPSDPTRASSSAVSSAAPTPSKVMEYVLKTDPSTQKEYIYAVRKSS